jgi:hypothetical protein
MILSNAPSLFQDQSLTIVEFESGLTKHGPFSLSNPSIDELPGPLPRLEEPEEGVNLIRLVLDTKVCKRACWKMDIARVASYAFGGLTQVVLR